MGAGQVTGCTEEAHGQSKVWQSQYPFKNNGYRRKTRQVLGAEAPLHVTGTCPYSLSSRRKSVSVPEFQGPILNMNNFAQSNQVSDPRTKLVTWLTWQPPPDMSPLLTPPLQEVAQGQAEHCSAPPATLHQVPQVEAHIEAKVTQVFSPLASKLTEET